MSDQGGKNRENDASNSHDGDRLPGGGDRHRRGGIGTAGAESDRAYCNARMSSETVDHNAYVVPGPVAGVLLVKCEETSIWGVGSPMVTTVGCKQGDSADRAYLCDRAGVISQSQWQDLQIRYNILCYNCGMIFNGRWIPGTRPPGQ